jgi:hypothetical protein
MTLWVKTGNALIEQSASGLPPKIRHPRFDKRLGSLYRSGRSKHWLKIKNPAAPAVRREAEGEWR